MGFTDNEIIKMLNEFISRNEDVNYAAITIDLLKDILDLINRQKAEIEKLRKRVNFVEQANVQLREELKETTEKFNCQQYVYADLSDIIRDKNAEIERLSDRNHKCLYLSDDETTEYCVDGPCPNYKTEAKIRTEAIKEFAERLKEKSEYIDTDEFWCDLVTTEDIDNLVKEMVGEG